MSRPFYPRKWHDTHCTGGWVGARAGLDRCGKSLPSPDRAAFSDLLYRLSNPGPPSTMGRRAFPGGKEGGLGLELRLKLGRTSYHSHPCLHWHLTGKMSSVHLGILVSLTEHVSMNGHFESHGAEHVKGRHISVEVSSGDSIYWSRNALN
jgi:hypothetical protein